MANNNLSINCTSFNTVNVSPRTYANNVITSELCMCGILPLEGWWQYQRKGPYTYIHVNETIPQSRIVTALCYGLCLGQRPNVCIPIKVTSFCTNDVFSIGYLQYYRSNSVDYICFTSNTLGWNGTIRSDCDCPYFCGPTIIRALDWTTFCCHCNPYNPS